MIHTKRQANYTSLEKWLNAVVYYYLLLTGTIAIANTVLFSTLSFRLHPRVMTKYLYPTVYCQIIMTMCSRPWNYVLLLILNILSIESALSVHRTRCQCIHVCMNLHFQLVYIDICFRILMLAMIWMMMTPTRSHAMTPLTKTSQSFSRSTSAKFD